jgi:hypothetical protein
VSERGVRLVLELEGDDPISGRAFRDKRLIGSFTGWMELYSAIERARAPRSDERRPASNQQHQQGGNNR